MILVMWGVILFGGKPAPKRTAGFAKNDRVLLFMVHGALKRYAHYREDRYPEKLVDLIPDYLAIGESEKFHLKKLNYRRDPEVGFRLSLAKHKKGSLKVILTSQGIETAP
jgi:hypothetical protein